MYLAFLLISDMYLALLLISDMYLALLLISDMNIMHQLEREGRLYRVFRGNFK